MSRTERPHRVENLIEWLAGSWTVEREINEGAGRFTGDARFAPDGRGGLSWREQGRLSIDGHDGPAYRNLRIVPGAGERAEVRFDDDRPFHDLDLRDGCWEPLHLCGLDTYRGRFTAQTHDHWTTCWRVSGPGRDDVIDTTYRRRPPPAPGH